MKGKLLKSLVRKRSIEIGGRETSIAIEDQFWQELKNIAVINQTTLYNLVAKIDKDRKHRNLSSAIRLYVLEYHRGKAP
jgi:predicted DNA-binding ribbon-helix-helix protein